MRKLTWLIAVTAPAITLVPLSAAHAQNINALLAACSSLPTQAARMECFEGVARGAAGAAPPTVIYAPAPGANGASSGVASRGVPGGFGADSMHHEREPRSRAVVDSGASEMSGRVVRATQSGAGSWTIALDNGSAWKMTDSVMSFVPPEANETARIVKGSLGSYKLMIEGQASVYVVRVR